jgi:hypothetical protein
LRYPVFDIAGQVLGHIVVEVGDADGLGNVADIVWVPDRHRGDGYMKCEETEGKENGSGMQ